MTIDSDDLLDLVRLNAWIHTQSLPIPPIEAVERFSGGYSNLTYEIRGADQMAYVLRRPPEGAGDIRRGHDMEREYRVLQALRSAGFERVPIPYLCCTETAVLGAPFYIVQKIEGVVLRAADLPHLKSSVDPASWQALSVAFCQQLAQLHAIDIQTTGLIGIGKPEGYIRRQVEGWAKRYSAAQTDPVPAMQVLADWLTANMPEEIAPTLLHNDFKYDNAILDPNNFASIRALLDWEMSTVGDPRMDLGTAMSYWSEAGDGPFERSFNVTWLKGNITRAEFVAQYAELTGRDCSEILYFYVFGLFKNAVVIQQIYRRFKLGLTQDPRFGGLLAGVHALSQKALISIEKGF